MPAQVLLKGYGTHSGGLWPQALAESKAYVTITGRKVINPAYEPATPDLLAIFPQGRAFLTTSNQSEVEKAFAAFLNALDARPTVFTPPARR